MSPGILISKRLVAINSASSVIRSILNLTVLIWLQQYFVEKIPEDEYAVLALVFPLLLFVPLLTNVVGGGIGRYVIEAYAKGDKRRVTQITSTLFPLCVIIATFVASIGSLLAWKIQAVLNINPEYVGDARIMFMILVTSATVRTLLIPFLVGVDVKQKFLYRNVLSLGLEVLRIAIIFTLLFGVSTRVLWMVVGIVPGTIIEIVIMFRYSRKLVPELRFDRHEIRRKLIRPITSFGGWTAVSRAAGIAREMSGPIMLSHFTGSLAVWQYRLGGYVESRFFPTVLSPLLTLQPALTGMHALGQEERMRRTFFRMSRYLLWAFLLFAIPGMIFHTEIWEVWLDPQYAERMRPGSIVLVLLFAKSFFVFPQPIIAQIALARARIAPLTKRTITIEITTVVVAFYLIYVRDLGAIGLATAALVVPAVLTPALIWTFALKLTESTFGEFAKRTIGPGLLPALLATPVWAGAWMWLPQTTWWQLFLSGAGGAVVYVVALAKLCMTPGERADFGKVFARFRRAPAN